MTNVINEKEIFKLNKFSNLKIHRREIKNTNIPVIVVDNLYVNPEEVRNFSSTLPYTKSKYVLSNSPGKRVKLDLDIRHLQDFTYELIGKEKTNQLTSFVIFNRIRSDEILSESQTIPHTDTIPGLSHAMVIYLNKDEECKGGTAFYRHKKTGIEFVKGIDDFTKVFESEKSSYDNFITDSNDDWELLELIEMKFNRMVMYPPNIYHSGYISRKDFIDYDRITQLGFF